ncbi:hypothetical protein [Sulfuricella denitrificans]|uniref:hypothetical protein n=1 Tax=Sulfuricella denitrificans TaxID=649841 RepID=UPI000287AC26|nr:hypothetical protein [Sulfuricella denitrificans]
MASDLTNLSQGTDLDNLFTTDQDTFGQWYLRGAIDARIDWTESPSGTKCL